MRDAVDVPKLAAGFSFIARPAGFEATKRALADTLRVAPWWDPVWIVDERLDDPDSVLDARWRRRCSTRDRLSMPVEVAPVAGDRELPPHADVVIAGGGIAGISTAMFLAERGIDTVVCEKGEVGAEQSGRNWGWCRTMGRDPREIPLAIESLKLWRGMNERVGGETGYRQCGTLYVCPDRKSYEKRKAWLPHASRFGLGSRMLHRLEVRRLLDSADLGWEGGLFTPEDGVAEPGLAVPAMAEAARRNGARIFTRCAVRGIELAKGGISAVVTEHGRISCNRFVVAGGVWSTLLCRSLGLRLPQLQVLASVLRTGPLDGGPSVAGWGPGLSFRKRLDGGYTVSSGTVLSQVTPDSFRYFRAFLPVLRTEWSGISLRMGRKLIDDWRRQPPWKPGGPSPFEEIRMLDPEPAARAIERARSNLERAFPVFKGVPTIASWAGMIDATPDLLPVISDVSDVRGLYLSTGYSGHGFGLGPGAGRLTADLVSREQPIVDPSPFRFSRFSDGSDLRPRAGL